MTHIQLQPGARAYHEPTRSYKTIERIDGDAVYVRGLPFPLCRKYFRPVCGRAGQ